MIVSASIAFYFWFVAVVDDRQAVWELAVRVLLAFGFTYMAVVEGHET